MLLLDGRSFLNARPNTPCEQTVEKERRFNMKSEHANHRKVLASFLEEIPENKGWWHRLPLASMSSKDGKPTATDAILPHLGTAFCLSEQAMLLFLVEMGTYEAKSKGHTIDAKGWDDLPAEFKAKSHVKVAETSFDRQTKWLQPDSIGVSRTQPHSHLEDVPDSHVHATANMSNDQSNQVRTI
jgi:hypothetical protein